MEFITILNNDRNLSLRLNCPFDPSHVGRTLYTYYLCIIKHDHRYETNL